MIISNQTAAYASAALTKNHKTGSKGRVQQDADQTQASPSDDDTLAVTQNNLTAASPLSDEDAAKASVESVRQNILGQPALAMMAQAKWMPKNAVRFLQQ